MYQLREDKTRHDAYRNQAGWPLETDRMELSVFEWGSGYTGKCQNLKGVSEVIQRPLCDLKIIFAPLDIPTPENAKDHLALINHFKMPSGFLSERLQSVGHSFGSQKDSDGTQCSWFHYLCKNINLEERKDGTFAIVNPSDFNRKDKKKLHQSDYSWNRSGFFLKGQPRHNNRPALTLICFGASLEVQRRLSSIDVTSSLEIIAADPIILFDVIFDELYLQVDNMAWKVQGIFGKMEYDVLASMPLTAAKNIDFVGMHNVSKHVIYLQEATSAALLTLKRLTQHHKLTIEVSDLSQATAESLQYSQSLFQTTELRLKSLEKRTTNLINLSFNLVTQQDSKTMQKDSSSMKTIAAMTLIFLPAGTVAAMFGSQFFNLSLDENETQQFIVSPLFWIFWAICLPVTVILVVLWQWWQWVNNRELNTTKPLQVTRTDTGFSSISVKWWQRRNKKEINTRESLELARTATGLSLGSV